MTFASSPFPNFRFERLGVPLKPHDVFDERLGVLNPGCARLRDGSLYLYPRIVAPGNISRIGLVRQHDRPDGKLEVEEVGIALEPQAPYEFRDAPGGYGCEDPRVTFIPLLDRYVMAYIAFGPRGPEVALAISSDGLTWERLGLMSFQESDERFAAKDAAFFPEPVRSLSGVESLAFYHRPTFKLWLESRERALKYLESLPPEQHESIAIGYVPLDAIRADIGNLCKVTETHRLELPKANWGEIKVGGGTPPVRVREGWLAVIHGVDEIDCPECGATLRYCAGVVIHEAEHVERVIYRSKDPLFVPQEDADSRNRRARRLSDRDRSARRARVRHLLRHGRLRDRSWSSHARTLLSTEDTRRLRPCFPDGVQHERQADGDCEIGRHVAEKIERTLRRRTSLGYAHLGDHPPNQY